MAAIQLWCRWIKRLLLIVRFTKCKLLFISSMIKCPRNELNNSYRVPWLSKIRRHKILNSIRVLHDKCELDRNLARSCRPDYRVSTMLPKGSVLSLQLCMCLYRVNSWNNFVQCLNRSFNSSMRIFILSKLMSNCNDCITSNQKVEIQNLTGQCLRQFLPPILEHLVFLAPSLLLRL